MHLISISKRGKRPPFWPGALLLVGLFLLLIGYFSLQSSLPSDATTYKNRQAKNKGQDLFFSPVDLPNDLVQSLDAILVLGGGRPKSIDHPPVFVERRCDDAIEVVRRRYERSTHKKTTILREAEKDLGRNLPILCLSAGTAHLPQLLSADGLPIWESTACAAYILSSTRMIPSESIYVETSSYDTIGNAYFARTSHTEINGWRKLLIVTNEFHMTRTIQIFDWVFSVSTETVTMTTGSKQISPYELYYLESPNIGMASEVVAARKEREASSSKSVKYLSTKYTTLRDVYKFLTLEHSLYAANRLVDRGRASAADVEESSFNDAVKRSYGAN